MEFETLLGLFINLHMDQSSSVLFSEVDQVCGCSRERTNFEVRAEFLNALNNVMFRVGGWAADNVAFTPTTNPGGFSRTDFGQLGHGTVYQDTSTTNDPGGRLIQIVLRLNF